MFGDVNRATLMGNVTKDPDLRFTPNGAAVLSFSMATNRRYKSGEEWKEEPTFHNIVIWRNAESLAKRIKKGTRIYLEGRIQVRSWDGQDGKKNYKTELVGESIVLIARYEGPDSSTSVDVDASAVEDAPTPDDSAIEPDDLPF